MVHPSDYVLKACIADKPITQCTLTNKCDECKKEIKQLNELDKMFASQFGLTYTKN